MGAIIVLLIISTVVSVVLIRRKRGMMNPWAETTIYIHVNNNVLQKTSIIMISSR